VDSGYTHIEIDKQLVKDKRIQTRLINFSFEVYNTNKIKNGNVTKVALLKVKINGHKEYIGAAIMDFKQNRHVKIENDGLGFYFILFSFISLFFYFLLSCRK